MSDDYRFCLYQQHNSVLSVKSVPFFGWNYPHALKGQKLLAQGSALGYHVRKFVAL